MMISDTEATMTERGSWRQAFLHTFTEQRWLPFLTVFFFYLITARLGESIYVSASTPYILIWIPAGFALAAILLGGYRLWIPIACAQLVAAIFSPTHPNLVSIVSSTMGQTMQPLIGVYVLKKLNFTGRFDKIREGPLLIGAAFVVSVIEPSVNYVASWMFMQGMTSTDLAIAWTRSYSAGVLSILVIAPLILSWYPLRRFHISRVGVGEVFAAFSLLIASTMFLSFFPSLAGGFGLAGFYLVLAVLFWIVLRMDVRLSTLSMFLVSAITMSGDLLVARANTTVSQELFATELTLEIIAVILLIFVTIAEERRAALRELEDEGEQLRVSMTRLDSEDRAKNEFIATLAHELRNPLSPVVSSLELLKLKTQDIDRPEVTQLIDVIDRHTHMVTRLLDDLLDISRISRRKLKLQKEAVELSAAIRRACETVESFYRARNHTLTVSLPEKPIWIEADPVRLEQIFINILFNAAKYTNPGGKIEITLTRDEDQPARISIRDNGIGIAPSMLTKIFDQFVQAGDDASVGTGLGIGLHLTKRLVEMHGGEVWAQSGGEGRGSEFIVMLPVPASLPFPKPESKSPLKRGRKALGLEKRRASKRILVVDDNEAAASGLKKLLEHFGHSVVLAYDGNSALAQSRSYEVDIILLDIGLPDMDGYAVAQALRREHGVGSFKLVALTGYGQDEDKARAFRAGFDAHLTKPVGMADLRAIL